MRKLENIGKWLYALSFCVFGIQHFMYADYVATLVPAWIPWHLFFSYLAGAAFMAVALSVIINKYVRLSCAMLSLLLALFVLLIHIPNLVGHPQNPQAWTRALQDVVIMGTALMLTGDLRLYLVGKYLFAVPMAILGMQHFAHLAFVTAMVPNWLPGRAAWDYLVGFIIVILAAGIISNRYLGVPAKLLGFFLFAFALLYHVPLLAINLYNGQQWTGFMLDIAIAGGAFIASSVSATGYQSLKMAVS